MIRLCSGMHKSSRNRGIKGAVGCTEKTPFQRSIHSCQTLLTHAPVPYSRVIGQLGANSVKPRESPGYGQTNATWGNSTGQTGHRRVSSRRPWFTGNDKGIWYMDNIIKIFCQQCHKWQEFIDTGSDMYGCPDCGFMVKKGDKEDS